MLLRLVSASQKNGRQKKTCSGCLSSTNSVSATILMFQHLTMHCFYQFLLMFSISTRILSLAHLFYAYFTHGPNTSASAQYDNTRGAWAWLTQEGCTITERKEGREEPLLITSYNTGRACHISISSASRRARHKSYAL